MNLIIIWLLENTLTHTHTPTHTRKHTSEAIAEKAPSQTTFLGTPILLLANTVLYNIWIL